MINELKTLRRLVETAGQDIVLAQFRKAACHVKSDGSMVTDADLASSDFLQNALAKHWPEINFLSEEMTAQEQMAVLSCDKPFWCLDPLDGTSNYVAGIPIFGVCIALIVDQRPVLGIIYDPVHNECFSAADGQGSWVNDTPTQEMNATAEPSMQRATALVDLKRLSLPIQRKLAVSPPYASQRNVGSCALEWAWMASKRGHLYLHGAQRIWDMAAGVLILQESGGLSQTLDGETSFKCELTPRSIVASPYRTLFNTWCQWLSKVQDDQIA